MRINLITSLSGMLFVTRSCSLSIFSYVFTGADIDINRKIIDHKRNVGQEICFSSDCLSDIFETMGKSLCRLLLVGSIAILHGNRFRRS